MRYLPKVYERFEDFYCEELIGAYFKNLISVNEILLRLDYDRISKQRELFNFLNLLLTENYPHKCYNQFCKEKLFFSNTFEYAKKFRNLTLKQFVKIWIMPHNFGKLKVCNIKISFFCCKCYEGVSNLDKVLISLSF